MRAPIRIPLLTACTLTTIAALSGVPGVSLAEAAPAVSADSFTITGTGVYSESNSAGISEARALASSTHVSLEQAIKYTQSTFPWDTVVDQIAEFDSENYSSAYRSGASDTGGTIVFVHPPSDSDIALLATLPFDTKVVVGAIGSADEIAAAINATDQPAKLAGLEPVVESANPRTGEITVGVAPASSDLLASGQAAVEKVVQAILGPTSVVHVTVTTTKMRPFAAYTGGGHKLLSTKSTFGDGTQQALCTSGFATVKNGVNGVTTAGHCYNYQLWGSQSGVISYDSSASSVSNGEIDLQFHKSVNGYTASPTFQATGKSSSDIQSVDFARNAVVGDYVNKYGYIGGYSQGCFVADLNTAIDVPSDDDGQMHHYVGLAHVTLGGSTCTQTSWQAGDSGGPVWEHKNGLNQAAGSVTGGDTDPSTGVGLNAYYTPQTRWSQNLGASILTDN